MSISVVSTANLYRNFPPLNIPFTVVLVNILVQSFFIFPLQLTYDTILVSDAQPCVLRSFLSDPHPVSSTHLTLRPVPTWPRVQYPPDPVSSTHLTPLHVALQCSWPHSLSCTVHPRDCFYNWPFAQFYGTFEWVYPSFIVTSLIPGGGERHLNSLCIHSDSACCLPTCCSVLVSSPQPPNRWNPYKNGGNSSHPCRLKHLHFLSSSFLK